MTGKPRPRAGWRVRKRYLENYVRAYGNLCPGFERMPHMAERLEVDHVQPVALGGRDTDGLRVLCPSCNRSRGGKLGRQLQRVANTDTPTRHSREW